MGVPRGHTRALVVRTTMLLLLSTAAAWNLMPVDMRCTATLARAACAPAMTVGEESAPVVKLVQEPQSLGEDEAMRAWLAQQDDPSYEGSWTGGAAVVAPHVTPPSAAASTVPGAALSDAQIKEVTMETLDVLLEILNQMAVLPDGSSVASEGLQAASALAATKLQRELSVARAVAAADPGEIGSQDAFAPLLAEVHGIASEAPAAGAPPRQPPAFVATPAVSPAAPAEATASDAAAKAAWLARQPKPSWGRQVAAVAAECDKGDAEACDSLLNEDEARLRWLAQQDSPAWGQGGAAAAPTAPADDEVIVRTMSSSLLIDDTALLAAASEAAAWLAKHDVHTGGQGGAAPPSSVVADAVADAEQAIGSMGEMLDVLAGLPEEEAKRAWLASQDHFSTAPAEEDAPALRAFVASPAPPLAATATEAEVLAQGERLLNEPGLNLTEQEKEAVRMAMAIIRRE